ncbi:hypothetical protein FOZ60_005335 [Perkinsus olseni]|uniref:Uncharacterized protein n=1 Tax=Perkinsus olseni TaxID=32597 RepID=A0A7J6NRC0_PEROL|nr:hypothetical protein FOZ60_005335 [Perkinsus olseni]
MTVLILDSQFSDVKHHWNQDLVTRLIPLNKTCTADEDSIDWIVTDMPFGNCREPKKADVARVLHAVSVVLKPETGRCELLSRSYKRLDAAAAGVDDTTVPRRPKNYVRELEAKFPDESSARKAMEEFAGCSMRSKGLPSIYKLRDIASIPELASEGRTRVDVCGVLVREGADHGANASRGTNIMIEDQTGVIHVTGWAQRGGLEASQTLLLIGNAKIISSSQIDETPPVLAVDSGAEVKVNPTILGSERSTGGSPGRRELLTEDNDDEDEHRSETERAGKRPRGRTGTTPEAKQRRIEIGFQREAMKEVATGDGEARPTPHLLAKGGDGSISLEYSEEKYGNCRGLFEMTHYDFLRRDNSVAIQDGGPSAAGQVDHLNLSEISASDMAALVSSVLEAGTSPRVDNEENEGVRTSSQCRRAFFDALDIIQNNNRGGVRTALLRGLNMLRQVVAQAKYIRDRNMYNTLCGENGSFRITVLHGVVNSVIYSAGVLRRLALFVLQIIHHKCSSREACRSPLPYIICCRIPSGNYLCVRVMPTSVSEGTRDRSTFATHFDDASTESGAMMEFRAFDNSVVEVEGKEFEVHILR